MRGTMAGRPKSSGAGSKVLGVDLAAQPKKTYACTLEVGKGQLVAHVHPSCDDDELVERAAGCAKVAIDAPFGWPVDFVEAVTQHQERGRWPAAEDGKTEKQIRSLCYRTTDIAVMGERRPLSVAADKLGVTAMRCARLLDRWEQEQGRSIDRSGDGQFLEVYPALALLRWGLPHKGYKELKKGDELTPLSAKLMRALGSFTFSIADHKRLVATNDDAFDALVAALVARAAQLNLTDGPPDTVAKERAETEGWIRAPRAQTSLKDLVPR